MSTKKNTSKGIVSWPEDERPRERLLSLGPQAMTDAELIAILVRVGLKGISAVELGRQLLNRFGSLRGMVEAPLLGSVLISVTRLVTQNLRTGSACETGMGSATVFQNDTQSDWIEQCKKTNPTRASASRRRSTPSLLRGTKQRSVRQCDYAPTKPSCFSTKMQFLPGAATEHPEA